MTSCDNGDDGPHPAKEKKTMLGGSTKEQRISEEALTMMSLMKCDNDDDMSSMGDVFDTLEGGDDDDDNDDGGGETDTEQETVDASTHSTINQGDAIITDKNNNNNKQAPFVFTTDRCVDLASDSPIRGDMAKLELVAAATANLENHSSMVDVKENGTTNNKASGKNKSKDHGIKNHRLVSFSNDEKREKRNSVNSKKSAASVKSEKSLGSILPPPPQEQNQMRTQQQSNNKRHKQNSKDNHAPSSSSTVRFGSIVLDEVLDIEGLQEEMNNSSRHQQDNQNRRHNHLPTKTWWQRRRELARRRRLQRDVTKQMQTFQRAHLANMFFTKQPDLREETKKLTTTWYPSPTGSGMSVSIQLSGKESPSFYSSMAYFSDFRDVTANKYFQSAPKDWHVVITDVKGSTKAIEAGRYKDVNTIGAASISVVMKLLENDFPFVFGGDGATLLIPPTDIGRVLETLLRLQRLAEEHFDLGLRVGHITVGEVYRAGGKIEVAKQELAAGRCVAAFRGGGLTIAEACIKGQEDKYCLQWKSSSEDVALEGLSCRWNAIPNKRGMIMSLLVCARDGMGNDSETYDRVIFELDKIYDGKLDEANPVNTDLMSYKAVGQIYEDEKRYHTNLWSPSFIDRVREVLWAVGIFRDGRDPKSFDNKHYLKSMRPHADHRKFDDMLRMVIDCSDDQEKRIEDLMTSLYKDGKIHYGIFLSDTALMTCYLEDLVDGEHIHFIDGGNGGYAMAAKQLKAQIKRDLLASHKS